MRYMSIVRTFAHVVTGPHYIFLRRVPLVLATMVFVLLLADMAVGADVIKYKSKTIIDLSGATIDGELTRPEGSYIVNRKLSKFSALIRVRMDFVAELRQAHNDI